MTKPITQLVTVLLLSVAVVGCTTTDASRKQARNAADLVGKYSIEQRERIAVLQAGYTDTQAKLAEAHVKAVRDYVELEQNMDHQRMADAMLLEWENRTLPSSVRDQYDEAVKRQLARLKEGREALAEARAAYFAAFTKLDRGLSKLDRVKSNLEALGTLESTKAKFNKLFALAQEVKNEYEKKKKKAEEDAKKAAADGQ